MPTVAEKRKQFRALHDSGCFALPNPWDIGSARYLQGLGFKALASSSAGFAFSKGLPDYGVPLDMMLSHLRELVENTDIPVNADFDNGYGETPEQVSQSVKLCVGTGVAGLSIEDSTGNPERPLYEVGEAVDRLAAARAGIADSGAILVARAECFLVGESDVDEVIRRLRAYSAVGADCLYAPGVSTREHIGELVAAVAPKPVNILVSSPNGLTIAEAAELGVRRVSVGGALARAAWGGFMRAASDLAEGRFDAFADAAPHGALNDFMTEDHARRRQPSSSSAS